MGKELGGGLLHGFGVNVCTVVSATDLSDALDGQDSPTHRVAPAVVCQQGLERLDKPDGEGRPTRKEPAQVEFAIAHTWHLYAPPTGPPVTDIRAWLMTLALWTLTQAVAHAFSAAIDYFL